MHCDTGHLVMRDLAPHRLAILTNALSDSPTLRHQNHGSIRFEGAFWVIPVSVGPLSILLRNIIGPLRRLAASLSVRSHHRPSTTTPAAAPASRRS